MFYDTQQEGTYTLCRFGSEYCIEREKRRLQRYARSPEALRSSPIHAGSKGTIFTASLGCEQFLVDQPHRRWEMMMHAVCMSCST
ncbi:hypothetical protein DOTSEDRAFT_91642 [Dothistroma septosporum NZE10]|uniref:Uncharacterized protein n=1 Tax=Dothistroma septosporum (strain NZE10 / CBS 128990) TaxID=675120 RepID=M2YJY9_DOTSN|nr:hypothetical protein DOTSEDRAFT_91642 [Dothistroma septosporum NZE10]